MKPAFPTRPAPTLADVAARCGVSTATVSRCLNFPEQVAEPTRNRVLTAVRALGYLPNFGAQAMAAKRTNTIGAIIPTMANAIFARGLQAFQDELSAQGFTLLIASSSYRADLEDAQIRALVARGADGLLLIGLERDAGLHDFLKERGVPAVITWAVDPSGEMPFVGFDNRAAMFALAAKVIALGHRQLAMISAVTASNDRASARVQGVRDAMQAAGLRDDTLRVMETPYGVDNGAAAFETLMQAATRPTVVLCGNDVLAVGALRRAREMGLDVPGDVSLTGFDDIELAQVAFPPLTTVRVPHGAMGQSAARMLIDLVRRKTTDTALILETEFCERASLARPVR